MAIINRPMVAYERHSLGQRLFNLKINSRNKYLRRCPQLFINFQNPITLRIKIQSDIESYQPEIEVKILHEGEINKARFMPQKSNVIATKTTSG